MSIWRISDLRLEIINACRKLGWNVRRTAFPILLEKEGITITIDEREATGPVSEKALRTWLKGIPSSDQIILINLGFFSQSAYKAILESKELRKRTFIISLGLRDYMDEELKPRALYVVKPLDLFLELLKVFEGKGIKLSLISCNFCESKAIALCNECENLLCKSHFMSCDFCRKTFCHHMIGRDCFFKHKCKE